MVTVIDRAGLEETACECYGTIQAELDELFPLHGPRQVSVPKLAALFAAISHPLCSILNRDGLPGGGCCLMREEKNIDATVVSWPLSQTVSHPDINSLNG